MPSAQPLALTDRRWPSFPPLDMTRVYSHPDPAITHLVQGALANAGIVSVVQGDKLGAATGEVPPIAAWSEVWVKDGDRLSEAEEIVALVTAEPDAEAKDWTCASCGETNEAQFGECWNCGADAPDDDTPEA